MSAETTTDVYAKATERLRDTLKWLLTSLAAVGAVLIAGLSLSNVGQASGDRMVAVVLGFVVAVVAVLGAAAVCAWVLGVGVNVTISTLPNKPDVAATIGTDEALMETVGAKGVGGLPKSLAEATAEQLKAYQEHLDDPRDRNKRDFFAAKDAEVARLNAVCAGVVRIATYQLVRRRFVLATSVVAVLAALAAVGIFAFAWGANPPETETARMPTVVETPSDVELRLTEAGQDRLRDELGADCVARPIRGVVLGDLGVSGYVVGVAGGGPCAASLVELGPGEGSVVLSE